MYDFDVNSVSFISLMCGTLRLQNQCRKTFCVVLASFSSISYGGKMSIGLLSNFLKIEDLQPLMSMREKRRLFSTFLPICLFNTDLKLFLILRTSEVFLRQLERVSQRSIRSNANRGRSMGGRTSRLGHNSSQ